MNRTYDFNDWVENPIDLFDARRYGECLHGAIQAYSVVRDSELTQAAVDDVGLLHELSHLATGVEINTHNDLSGLRAELVDLLEKVKNARDS